MIDSDTKEELKILIGKGKKIDAIRMIMDNYHVRLAEATRLEQSLEREMRGQGKRFTMPFEKIIIFSLGVIGFVFLNVTAFLYWKDLQGAQHKVAVIGRVIGLEEKGNMYTPVIEFSHLGRTQTYTGNVYSSPSSFEINESVNLLYDPENAENTVIDSFFHRYFIEFVLGIIGAGFGLFALLFQILTRKKF